MMDAETAVMPSQAKNIRNADKHQKLGEASKTSLLCDNLEGWDRAGGGGRFKREGTRVYLGPIHVDVWQKPTQHCEAIIL